MSDALRQLYENFVQADIFVNELQKKELFDYKLTKVNMISQIPKPEITDSYYFPQEIQDYVDENASYVLHYSTTIQKRNVNLYFTIFDELSAQEMRTLNNCVYMIYMWIFIVNIYAKKSCSKTFVLYTYLTPFKKRLPTNQLISLNAEHVNTAYTSGCRENTETVIFRKEEWFKVFIHETFHNFGLDFSNMNMTDVNSKLNTIFNVNVDYKLYESYCETWARIINVIFHAYNRSHNLVQSDKSEKSVQYSSFVKLFTKYMKYECTHSMTQSLKILQFMNLNYKLVTSKKQTAITACKHLYKEETAVFTYYVITGLLVNNYLHFMNWCLANNPSFLQFDKTIGNLNNYIEMIRKYKDDKNTKQNIKKIENNLNKMVSTNNLTPLQQTLMLSLQMSVIDNIVKN
jgi:hypothetical protein